MSGECKKGLAWIITAALLMLAGCSAVRLTYNQGPTLAYWWLDRYADFSSSQSPKVKAALADWFAWHRSSQLPDYREALAALQPMAVDNINAEQVCAHTVQWQRRGELAFDQAVPALADIVRTLSADQIKHIQGRYAKVNEEAEDEYLQPDPADRRKAAFKRTLERAESLYGKLDDAQRKLLTDGLAVSPFDPQRWMAERVQRQQDILRQLRDWQASPPDVATVQAWLRRLAQDQLQSPRPAYRAYNQQLTAANCALTAQLHNATRPAQRRVAVDKLKGWEDDVKALIKTAPQAGLGMAPRLVANPTTNTPNSLPLHLAAIDAVGWLAGERP